MELLEQGPRFQTWAVTPKGRNSIHAGEVVSKPEFALLPRDRDFAEMSVWELVASLSKNGWQHAVREPPRRTRGRDPEPLIYSPGSDKIWFTRLRTTSISSHYLRALLLADSSGTEVQHFQSSGFYMALLDGKPYTRCRRVHLQIKHFAEDDMDAGYEKPKRQRPKKAPTSDRVFAVPVEDGPVQEEEGPMEVEEDEWSVGSEDDDDEEEEEEEEEEDEENKGGEDLEHEEDVEAQEEEEDEENEPSPDVIPDPLDVGLNRMTPVKSKAGKFLGWEAGCNHPLHQFPLACRKNLRNEGKGRDEKLTRRMLCAWLYMGADLTDRPAHFNDCWSKIQTDAMERRKA